MTCTACVGSYIKANTEMIKANRCSRASPIGLCKGSKQHRFVDAITNVQTRIQTSLRRRKKVENVLCFIYEGSTLNRILIFLAKNKSTSNVVKIYSLIWCERLSSPNKSHAKLIPFDQHKVSVATIFSLKELFKIRYFIGTSSLTFYHRAINPACNQQSILANTIDIPSVAEPFLVFCTTNS